jgi:hypothetical protein
MGSALREASERLLCARDRRGSNAVDCEAHSRVTDHGEKDNRLGATRGASRDGIFFRQRQQSCATHRAGLGTARDERSEARRFPTD